MQGFSIGVAGGPAAAPAVTALGLVKTYRTGWGRKVEALQNVGFTVPRGEIFGLLGPNGAGKSTTLKIILGLLNPSKGSGTVFGSPFGSVTARARMGFLPENAYFYDYLTAREFLGTCAALCGIPRKGMAERVTAMLGRVGLDPDENRRLRKFSKGMLQRVGLAQALIHDPDLVILDEPMSGLDPTGRRQVRDLILGLKEEGKTVIFSSHILSDVESICDRVGILVSGRLRRTGRVGEITEGIRTGYEIEAETLPESLWQTWLAGGTARKSGDRVIVFAEGQTDLDRRVRQVLNSGAVLHAIKPLRGTLEDVFLQEVHGSNRGSLDSVDSNPGKSAA